MVQEILACDPHKAANNGGGGGGGGGEAIDMLDLPTDFKPLLPTIKHTSVVCDISREEYPKRGAIAAGDMTYPINDVLIKLRNILTQLVEVASESDPITVRFVIAGGNEILNATACAYATLFRYYSGLLQCFELEFMVIPYSMNHYAEWLAREDPWYNRHVFVPLQSRLLVVPALDHKTRVKKRVSGNLTVVGKFYCDMAEDYSRESEHTVRLMLWECHCWNGDLQTSTNTPDHVIPFCQRVEIGRNAEFEGYKAMYNQSKDNDSDVSEDSKEESKLDIPRTSSNTNNAFATPTAEELKQTQEYTDSFDYTPPTFLIEWQNVDMIGNPSGSVLQKNQQFENFVFSTCPRYGDPLAPPSPNEEGVAKMYASVKVSTKKKRRAERFSLLSEEPVQHIRSVSLKSKEERFWVQIDDRLYGPYTRLKITPMVNPLTMRQVFMPIQTFFPVDTASKFEN